MKPLILLTLFSCLILMQCVSLRDLSPSASKIQNIRHHRLVPNCPSYSDIGLVNQTFPFKLNFTSFSSTKTSAKTDEYGNIKSINIINEQYLPLSISCLTRLHSLHVEGTTFPTFYFYVPMFVRQLSSSLVHLVIKNTSFNELPYTIGKFRRLKSLEITSADLQSVSDLIGELSSLETLRLSNNSLSSIPSTIIKNSRLTTFDINDNKRIQSIQSLNGHPYLVTLSADNCSIEEIPTDLPKLVNLYVRNNKIHDVSKIGTLGNGTDERKNFDFSKNSIRYLTPFIRNVKKLCYLNLDYNKLDVLPMDIYQVKTLKHLWIRNNNFKNETINEIKTNMINTTIDA
ncbi:unnamed protein product [Adineta ricciae]|uniref:Uncharacterized protein n=1 Tax=Adineta ricciae TaxID=249248 RepID=A0A814KKQ1_ADIRI|nr:unnamed protein product [Adineta ricciae]CAF1471817.1 unnamed protein product [Adineta ricciae]